MLVRLAKVVWWLGALLLLAAVGVQLAMRPPQPRVDPAGAFCAQAFRIDAEKRSAAPTAASSKTLSQQAADDQQQSTLEECRAAATPLPVPPWNRALAFIALGVPGVGLWALAFVLAGSFWRPPSTRVSSRTELVV